MTQILHHREWLIAVNSKGWQLVRREWTTVAVRTGWSGGSILLWIAIILAKDVVGRRRLLLRSKVPSEKGVKTQYQMR